MSHAITDGPRGRRLCLELAQLLDDRVRRHVIDLGYDLDPDRGTSVLLIGDGRYEPTGSVEELVALLDDVDARGAEAGNVVEALLRSVASARYWQEPDGDDVLAALPEVRSALEPIGAALSDRPDLTWWHEDRRVAQWTIDWRDAADPAPFVSDPAVELVRWHDATRTEEITSARERPSDPLANWSGTWWSAPTTLPHTTGELTDGRPAGLVLVEDSLGWEVATAIPVRGAGRTFEIRGPGDWAELCRRHPLEVTASRRQDWYRTTGRDGRWVMPDWLSVATEWDAVHLTTTGYLTAATREIPVEDGTSSVIAGWAPDTTYWLPTSRARSRSLAPSGAWSRTSECAPGDPLRRGRTRQNPGVRRDPG
ncbi:hypothetical protein [Microbacterium sp. JZ31]|uniref:hypothetical protein n=1 Tax=Microbacterium sp. JZ31 TaxID=1906274 RepID=UPI001EE3A49C|nr:hypothetical protein [Microbacterium sp. JZ31]